MKATIEKLKKQLKEKDLIIKDQVDLNVKISQEKSTLQAQIEKTKRPIPATVIVTEKDGHIMVDIQGCTKTKALFRLQMAALQLKHLISDTQI